MENKPKLECGLSKAIIEMCCPDAPNKSCKDCQSTQYECMENQKEVEQALIKRGEVGELIVRGDAVMREYYRNPEATAKTLRDGWLFTGDMAKQDEDGFIFLVDRKKDLIISGGENVFPVEVEDFLHTHPSIKDVAAIGYPDERLGEMVTVIIDVKPEKVLTEEEVLKYCEQLPKYKRPKKIFFGEVPRNPTGKIEKPKLRKKYIGMQESFKID